MTDYKQKLEQVRDRLAEKYYPASESELSKLGLPSFNDIQRDGYLFGFIALAPLLLKAVDVLKAYDLSPKDADDFDKASAFLAEFEAFLKET